jgi:DNA polymerase V
MDNNIFFSGASIINGKNQLRAWKDKLEKGSMENEIDLNQELAQNMESTYVLMVRTNVMESAGIKKGDMVIADRAIEPLNGQVIIADLEGELLIRRFDLSNGKVHLLAGTGLAPIAIENFSRKHVWGVVTYIIHPV